jgi:hypothetical protein
MNVRKPAGHLALLGASVAIAAGFAGCGPRANDINQVQPGYVKKSIFLQDSEWYYKRTIAKSELLNTYVIEGMGDWALDRVRWRIEENLLIAYKPYEAIPGTSTEEYPGTTKYEGPALAVFPISEHFDIKRGYDPTTGNETNVIAENTTDRVWSQRDYMRVDWSTNMIEQDVFADYSGDWFPVHFVSTGDYWSDQDTKPTDEYASRFTNDYVEVNMHAFIGMDLWECASFVGFSSAGFEGCGYGEAMVRHSFVRVKTPSDYIPHDYPDSVVLKQKDGTPCMSGSTDPACQTVPDPNTGEILRQPIYSRFGFFRVETPTYDRGYGATDAGRLLRAYNFNIWQRHTDDQGNVIPISQRTPKPITYYLNADFPDRWKKYAFEVGAEYDRVFKSMVSDLVGAAKTPDHMFQVMENDCNIANVKAFVTNSKSINNKDLEYAVARAVCPDGTACDSPMDKIAIGNLTTVCTSLEAATRDAKTNIPAFEWQRIGDGRWFMLVWFNNPQDSGWSGLGLVNPDARTGESVSGAAYLRGYDFEVAAATIQDYINLINDCQDGDAQCAAQIQNIVYGQDIRRQVATDIKRAQQMANTVPSAAYLELIGQRLAAFGITADQRLAEKLYPQEQDNRLSLGEDSSLSDALISNLDVAMAARGNWTPQGPWGSGPALMGNGQGKVPGALPAVVDDATLKHLASPLGRIAETAQHSAKRETARNTMSHAGFCFPKFDFDIHWAGLALELKDVPPDQQYEMIASRLIKHVMLHELGHNVGFRHNFEGTYDALNYFDEFWPQNPAVDPSVTDDERVMNKYDEYRNSTVMEYIGQGKGLFTDRLGKYDEAAIRFAYANQVAVFDDPSVDQNAFIDNASGAKGAFVLKNWRYNNDYSKLPSHLCGGCTDTQTKLNVIQHRHWENFDPQNPPIQEVPFHFCSDEYNRSTPFCSTFDYGSNLKEIFANYYTWWAHYFFFNNFIRDRLGPVNWDPFRATIPAQTTLEFASTVGQYFYYYSAQDPTFRNTDLGQDMLTTVAHGMNFASEVISTPEPLRMCPWPGASNPRIYIPWYYLNNCDQYAPLDSHYAAMAKAIQMPLGDARPAAIGITEDYEDFDWSFVGSYFDKANVLWLLGYNRPHFWFRFSYDFDIRNYQISLYRLFEPELRNFYDKVVNFDGYFIEQQTALDLGSYWCTDAPDDTPSIGHFEPRKMIDPASANPALPGPSATCKNPAVVYPTLLRNMPYDAMFYTHALFSSDFDAQLNMGKSMKIYAVGSDDDYPFWDQLTPADYCSTTDSLTGITFRSIHQPTNIPDLGCRLINRADQAQTDWLGSMGDPGYKDRWRAWFERLEWARDLTRLFNNYRSRVPSVGNCWAGSRPCGN